jgi:hypothetical protein
MTSQQIIDIGTERLDRWRALLALEHATPALLLGISHDHKSGALVICAVEEMTNAGIRLLLRGALRLLEKES